MQNLGGKGRSSKSNLAEVDGCVNGSGTEPPKSAVEQETPIRAKAALAAMRLNFISAFLGKPTLSVNRISQLNVHEFGRDP